jgi:hypothetical protein
MRARRLACVFAAFAVCLPLLAAAEPKPLPVDIKAFRDELLVFQDATGGTYVVKPGRDPRAFYGTGKVLHEQVITGRSANGDAWSVSVWAPRVPELRPGQIVRKADGTFQKQCDGKDDPALTQLTGDKANAVLDKYQFMTTALVRRPYLLGRDDSGVYYYVDVIAKQYGGKGFRVFVGKKGAMKELPLTDVASDSAGDVFATKSGDLRLVGGARTGGDTKVTWIKGEKRTELVWLDLDVNSRLIFRDLGIYKFTGTICDNI